MKYHKYSFIFKFSMIDLVGFDDEIPHFNDL